MAVSVNYATLQKAIADELGDRQDLMSPLSDSGLTDSPIKNAIQSAIAKHERESFYFNELNDVNLFNTVIGQELYTTADSALIATMSDLLAVHILIGGNRYILDRQPWQYIETVSVNPSVTGQPTDYAYLAESMRLYPIPNGVYPVTLTGTQRFAALVNDADSNAWTTDGYDLIRSEAKLLLARDVLHDPQIMAECKLAIYGDPSQPKDDGFLGALKGETARRGKGRIRSTSF